MYGLTFHNNQDLRRILTDYGFLGNALLKDFPLTGYFEISNLTPANKLEYAPVKLAQNLRFIDTNKALAMVKTIEGEVGDIGDAFGGKGAIIAGVVCVGAILYLAWDNWPPRKGPNKGPNKEPDKPKAIKRQSRFELRKEIVEQNGSAIDTYFHSYRDAPGYALLDDPVKKALEIKYDALKEQYITRLADDMFENMLHCHTITEKVKFDEISCLNAKITRLHIFMEQQMKNYSKGIEYGAYPVDESSFLFFFDDALPRKLTRYIDLTDLLA